MQFYGLNRFHTFTVFYINERLINNEISFVTQNRTEIASEKQARLLRTLTAKTGAQSSIKFPISTNIAQPQSYLYDVAKLVSLVSIPTCSTNYVWLRSKEHFIGFITYSKNGLWHQII